VETIGSKRSYALTWCMPNNDDDDDDDDDVRLPYRPVPNLPTAEGWKAELT